MNRNDPSTLWKQLADTSDFDALDIDAVRERLDDVVPGEWDLTLELLPSRLDAGDARCAFKARVQILGVIREGVGLGDDYRKAADAAFLDAASRFGVVVRSEAA